MTDEHGTNHDADLEARIITGVRDIHALLGLGEPTDEELRGAIERACNSTLGPTRLKEMASRQELETLLEIRPLNIEMDIVNKCNIRCTMCNMSHPSHYRRKFSAFSLEDFEKLAKQVFWHVHALSLSYGTEPLLHKEFVHFLSIANRYKIPKTYAATNGQLLTEEVSRELVANAFHTLTVSIDAAKQETYERIRVGARWDVLIKNLSALRQVKKHARSVFPHLELAFVMMRSNIEELPAFLEMAAELGACTVHAIHMVPFEMLDITNESCSNIKEATNAIIRESRRVAERVGVRFLCPQEFGAERQEGVVESGIERFGLPVTATTKQSGTCPFPWHFMAIDQAGNVVPCGWWQGGQPMGNIHAEGFDSIWRGEPYQALRAEHRSGRLCRTCIMCPAAGPGSPDGDMAFAERA